MLPFYGGFFIYSLAPLIYFVSSRYRFGLSPFVLFFACGALEWMHQRRKERKSLFIAALLFVPAFTLLIDAKVPADSHSYTWRSVVQALRLQTAAAGLRNQGKRKASAQKVAESIAASPFLSDGLMLANLPYGKNEPWQTAISMKKCSMDPAPEECIFDLGFLYLQSGHYREAKELMETLTRKKTTFPRWYLGSPDPRYYLARIASEFEKNDALALEYYRKALRNNPGDFECLAGITVTLERTGKAKEADVYRKKLFRYVDEIDATYYLGKAYWYAGEYEKSASCFLQVQRWIPEERKNGIYAAAALGQSGKLKDAIAMYAKRMQQKQDPILLQREILNTFESYRDQHLESAEAHYMLGIILRQFGDFDAARKAQEQALLLDPNLEAAKHELQLIDSVQ